MKKISVFIFASLCFGVLIISCGKVNEKKATPEQTFESITQLVKDIESGKRSNDSLEKYFYRSPREEEGFVVIERVKMRALQEVILSRIMSYTIVEKRLVDPSKVELIVRYTYKDPIQPGGPVGNDTGKFVFVKQGAEWKMDCGS